MISIVIVNYNDWNTTVSFVKQIESYSILDHIIIVDNCSTDNSFVMLKKQMGFFLNKAYGVR